MPTTYTGQKRSRKAKVRKKRDTRRAIREVIAKGEEFSARYVYDKIKDAGLASKCVLDMGQFLLEEARSESWVIKTKHTGTPRYTLVDDCCELIEVEMEKGTNTVSDTTSDTTSVYARLDLIKPFEGLTSLAGFTRSAETTLRYIEAFATVLGDEDHLIKDVVKEILYRVCGIDRSQIRPNSIGKVLQSLIRQTRLRPALLDYRGFDAFNNKLVTLSEAGIRVAKGTWALRDSSAGVRVFNFASGCFVGPEEQEKETPVPKEKTRPEPPFNPPRLSPSEPPQEPVEPCQAPDTGSPVKQAPGKARRVSAATPELCSVTPIASASASSIHHDFYLSRASQRIFEVLVTECHPSDYEQVIDKLVHKLTGGVRSVFGKAMESK